MIRYYLYTEIKDGIWTVHYSYNGEVISVVCDDEQHAKNLFDEINSEKTGFPIV